MIEKENHFRKLASRNLSNDYRFYYMIDDLQFLHFQIEKLNVKSSVKQFHLSLDDDFFIKHLELQKKEVNEFLENRK